MTIACPACGFLTVPENSYCNYNICEVCGWEDDGVQLANPACGGGANKKSLIDAQKAAMIEHPLEQYDVKGIKRDKSWRPLNPDEIAKAEKERTEKYWMNMAICEAKDAYWRTSA